MSAPKFTPGPWALAREYDIEIPGHEGDRRFVSIENEDFYAGGGVALVHITGRAQGPEYDKARLISAAPELYEAASEVAALYADEPEENLDPAWMKLRAALAKAVQP